jgi:hypothetical protein
MNIGLDSSGTGERSMIDCCEDDNEISGSINFEKFSGTLSDYHLLQ